MRVPSARIARLSARSRVLPLTEIKDVLAKQSDKAKKLGEQAAQDAKK